MADPVKPKVTIWYDGGCPLCLREIAIMRRLDRRGAIALVDLSPADSACPLDRTVMLARFHAREGDGPILDGAAAFAAMWRAIPVLRPLGLLARNRLVITGLEAMYRQFLRIRPRLQQLLRGPRPT